MAADDQANPGAAAEKDAAVSLEFVATAQLLEELAKRHHAAIFAGRPLTNDGLVDVKVWGDMLAVQGLGAFVRRDLSFRIRRAAEDE